MLPVLYAIVLIGPNNFGVKLLKPGSALLPVFVEVGGHWDFDDNAARVSVVTSGVPMSYLKTIVCFANSRKMAGRCIAGKEWLGGTPGGWVRPVSTRPTHEVSEEERRFENGRDPQPLDIVSVPCNEHNPLPHQRENHVIHPDYYWVKTGQLSWIDVAGWLDNPANLWGLGQSSYAGLNNRVAMGQQDGTSLCLISVERLRLWVGPKAPGYQNPKRSVRGEFFYRGNTYRMDVTDPAVERIYLNLTDGQYDIVNPCLCISLGDPYQDYYYKLIAAVLYPGRFT